MATPDRIRRRGRWSLALGTLASFAAFAAVAFAADIQTDAVLGTSVPTATEVSIGDNSFQIKVWATGNINNPSATGQAVVVNKYFMATNGTITPSASAADKTTLTFATQQNYSQNPPCGLTQATSIQGCLSNPFVVNATLAVAPGTPDDTTGTLTVSNTGSQGLTADGTPDTGVVQVNAPPANTAPIVSVTGVTNGATYEVGSVPAGGCSVVDTEDGNHTFAATLSAISGPLSAYGLGSQTASCSYTDDGGLSASASATYSIVDTTDPLITFLSSNPAANGNGWNNSDVTVTWSCSDSGSGVVTSTVDETISTEGLNQSATGTCEDHAGNTATDTQSGINIDKTAPGVAYTSQSPAANAAGWNKTDVVATFTATDPLSGFAGPSTTMTSTSTSSGEGAAVTVDSPAFTDLAGNEAAAGAASHSFMIDLTDPTVAITSPVTGLTTIATSIQVTGTASDTPSGIKTVTVNGGATDNAASWTTSANVALGCGANTLTATATDNADRTMTSGSITVTRLCFGLQYMQPIDQSTSSPIVNSGKYGRVIPVKVLLSLAGGGALNDTALSSYGLTLQMGVNTAMCASGAATDSLEEFADAGQSSSGTNVFRWDPTAGQWIYNLDTKAPPGMTMAINSCYRLDVYVSDGTNKVKISTSTYALFKPTK